MARNPNFTVCGFDKACSTTELAVVSNSSIANVSCDACRSNQTERGYLNRSVVCLITSSRRRLSPSSPMQKHSFPSKSIAQNFFFPLAPPFFAVAQDLPSCFSFGFVFICFPFLDSHHPCRSHCDQSVEVAVIIHCHGKYDVRHFEWPAVR